MHTYVIIDMSQAEAQRPGVGEQEPLLGRAGDASQQEGLPLYHNFIIGVSALVTLSNGSSVLTTL